MAADMMADWSDAWSAIGNVKDVPFSTCVRKAPTSTPASARFAFAIAARVLRQVVDEL